MSRRKGVPWAAVLLAVCAPLARAAVDPSPLEPPAKLLAGELLAAQRSWAGARSSEPWALELSGFEPAALRPEAADALRFFWGALVDALGRPEDGALLLPGAWEKPPEYSSSAAISRLGGWAGETAAGLRVQALLTERGTGRLLFSRRLDLIAGVPPAVEPPAAAPRTIPPAAERRRRWTLAAGAGPLFSDGVSYQAALVLAKDGTPWSLMLDYVEFPEQSRWISFYDSKTIRTLSRTTILKTRAMRLFGRRHFRIPAWLREDRRGWLLPDDVFALAGAGLYLNRVPERIEVYDSNNLLSRTENTSTVVNLAPVFGGGVSFALPWKLRLDLEGIYTPPTNRLGVNGLGFDGVKLGVLVLCPFASWGGR